MSSAIDIKYLLYRGWTQGWYLQKWLNDLARTKFIRAHKNSTKKMVYGKIKFFFFLLCLRCGQPTISGSLNGFKIPALGAKQKNVFRVHK